jgi:hypothetical protein
MDERTFFEYEDVKVTNARFVSGGQTYAMQNVTSVKPFEQKPSRFGGALILLVGLALMTSDNIVLGLLIAAGAAFYLYQQKTIFHVLPATSAGETTALRTYQRDYLGKVIAALNNVIVSRG